MRHSIYTYILAIFSLVSFLGACGGGGGGGGSAAPKITSAASVSVVENTSEVLKLTAVDPEGGAVGFSITGGIDQSLFSISGHILSFSSAPDFENPADSNTDNIYQLEVTATTASGQSAVQAITVTVTDDGRKLNDTGLTWGGEHPAGNNSNCSGEAIDAQDCSHGRDVTHNDNSDGYAGFSFTKLGANGEILADTATQWSCVKDNVTGLVWEVKTDDGQLRDKGWSYASYDSRYADGDDTHWTVDSSTNVGSDGVWAGPVDTGVGVNIENCGNSSRICTTEQYVADVNEETLCGASDWRMPTREELRSIVHYGHADPAIDTAYFPNTIAEYVWSASVYVSSSKVSAWLINFSHGDDIINSRNNGYRVRLVRGG